MSPEDRIHEIDTRIIKNMSAVAVRFEMALEQVLAAQTLDEARAAAKAALRLRTKRSRQ